MNDDDITLRIVKPIADELEPREVQHPRPWWYSLALRLFPGRCREIPEADNPTWCEHRNPVTHGDVESRRFPAGTVGICRQCGAPPRILLRQVSIWKRHWYLQQFACSEDPRFMHSHPAKFMIVIGLWGSYTEQRIAGAPIKRSAPYVYTMDAGHVHHVQKPGRGHTSLFLMFGVQHDAEVGDKMYFGAPVDTDSTGVVQPEQPTTLTRHWKQHIRRKVARI